LHNEIGYVSLLSCKISRHSENHDIKILNQILPTVALRAWLPIYIYIYIWFSLKDDLLKNLNLNLGDILNGTVLITVWLLWWIVESKLSMVFSYKLFPWVFIYTLMVFLVVDIIFLVLGTRQIDYSKWYSTNYVLFCFELICEMNRNGFKCSQVEICYRIYFFMENKFALNWFLLGLKTIFFYIYRG